MKQTQEFDGKNIDNAVEKACLALNVSKKNLVYDVISSGSTGIFGIVGVKKARIRVTLPEKKDSGAALNSSSYDGDRAGVISIVDEAFGKEIKPVNENFSSEDQLSGNRVSAERAAIAENGDILENGRAPDRKKPLDGRQKTPGDKASTARSRRGRSSGRKPASENALPEKAALEGDSVEQAVDKKVATKKPVFKKEVKGQPAPAKPATAKPYSRKNRIRKRDTWLRADGDAVLNDAIASADEAAESQRQRDVESDLQAEMAAEKVISADKNNPTISDTSQRDGSMTISVAGVENGEKSATDHDTGYTIDPDYEFLDEDFEAPAEGDDEPSSNSDEEMLEVYDERDDGYPPKYKGEIPIDVSEEAMRIGRETLQKMVALITEDATVVAQSDEDRLLLKVEGGNSGVLIGRRGQTLEAMQFLTDKIINRYSESRVRLKVDIEGYMETRKANLRTLAYKMADKAKKTGKPATINQMTAQDRRIVHIALKDDTRVRTQSMGDGYYRRLVIFPKKSSFKKRKTFKKPD